MSTIENPYKRPPPRPVVAAAAVVVTNEAMGPQSQRRLTLNGRTHQMQSNNNNRLPKKLKAGDQQTLFGCRAFDPNQDCIKCKGKLYGRNIHRAHHPLCWNNRNTRGIISTTTMESIEEDKRLKQHFAKPLRDNERFSSANATKEATVAFFTPRQLTVQQSTTTTTTTTTMTATHDDKNAVIKPKDLCLAVTAKIATPSFVEEHRDRRAPLAMIAFAGAVMELMGRGKSNNLMDYFDGLTITVPDTKEIMSPQYHSIVGQKLLYVDWIKMFGLEVQCPWCPTGALVNDRTNFSKNKMLFPIFDIDGPPSWPMVQSMVCRGCRVRTYANTDTVICQLLAYARTSYPVEPKFALSNKNCHIGRTATQAFDLLMPTYGNGDLCSRLLVTQ